MLILGNINKPYARLTNAKDEKNKTIVESAILPTDVDGKPFNPAMNSEQTAITSKVRGKLPNRTMSTSKKL